MQAQAKRGWAGKRLVNAPHPSCGGLRLCRASRSIARWPRWRPRHGRDDVIRFHYAKKQTALGIPSAVCFFAPFRWLTSLSPMSGSPAVVVGHGQYLGILVPIPRHGRINKTVSPLPLTGPFGLRFKPFSLRRLAGVARLAAKPSSLDNLATFGQRASHQQA